MSVPLPPSPAEFPISPELNPAIADWCVTTTNLHRIVQRCYEAAVLPTGAIEAHNRHLP
jgi:hypothetical protein